MWVYDMVYSKKIVALCYHEGTLGFWHPDCLGNSATNDLLEKEGLFVHTSQSFETLEEARAHAWQNRDQFADDLD